MFIAELTVSDCGPILNEYKPKCKVKMILPNIWTFYIKLEYNDPLISQQLKEDNRIEKCIIDLNFEAIKNLEPTKNIKEI